MLDWAYRLALMVDQRPLLKWAVIGALTIASLVMWALRLEAVRQQARRFAYIFRNTMSPEARLNDLTHWFAVSLGAGITLAALKVIAKGTWLEFWIVLLLYLGSQAFAAILASVAKSELIARPLLGRMWREDRKIRVGAILKKTNRLQEGSLPISRSTFEDLASDLLGVVVMHVRDYRGNHKTVDVFASLLLVDGSDLVVVSRDPTLRSNKDLKRTFPVRYEGSSLAASRAVGSRRPVAVGDYHVDYPDFPKNKPYRSILSLPVISSDDTTVLGVLCIDSSRPYFFDGFTPGALENSLDNSLAPYVHTLVLIIETLVSRDAKEMLRLLLEHSGKEGA